MERSLSRGEVPLRLLVPHSMVVAVIGCSAPSAASLFPRREARSRVGVTIWSTPLVERRRSPLVPEGSGGSPIHEGRSVRTGHAEALSWRRCSGSPEQSVGDRSPYPWCCAGPDGCALRHRSLVYARGAQCGVLGMPVQLVADAAAVVVVHPRAQV